MPQSTRNEGSDVKLCLAIAALVYSALAMAASSENPASWTRSTEPFEVFDDVYWVGTEGLAAYLFSTADGLILLDVGMPQNAELVEASIRKLGFAVEDVRYLLNSHAHLDHSGGLARLKADSGAQLVASAGDRYALEKGVYPGWESRTDLNFPAVDVDRVIGDGDTVSLGGITLTANLTPGHSPGCTTWSFTARDRGREYRALVFCSASVALNRLVPDPQYLGIVDDYRDTFRRMKTMQVDAYLAPHPEQFGLAEKRAGLGEGETNPFVDPTEKDRRMAAFEQAFYETLTAQQQAGR
jgi:metallo-beta-lactamase class B